MEISGVRRVVLTEYSNDILYIRQQELIVFYLKMNIILNFITTCSLQLTNGGACNTISRDLMEKTELLKELRGIGLPDKASLVYACLIEMGIGFPSKIAERTKLNRSTVYHTLHELAIRGLVSRVERGKKICFQLEKPTQLVSFAKKQIGLAEERLDRAKTILPELEGLFALTPHKPRVRFFEGLQGILAVYEEHLQVSEPYEMLGYSNVEELMRVLPPKFVMEYTKKKEKQEITTRGIFPDTPF